MASPTALPLLLPEILHMICEHLYDKKRTLANLAMTCSALEKPALDLLWLELNTFYPLAKCLPSELWIEVPRPGGKSMLMLQQPLSRPDCNRLVRNVYHGIYTVLGDTKLLPNVRSLTWLLDHDNDHRLSSVRMFLGPHLGQIYLHAGDASQSASLVSILGDLYPSLQKFRFKWKHHPQKQRRVVDIVSNTIFKWHHLKSLEVSTVTSSTLVALSTLPNLVHLEVSRWVVDVATPDTLRKGGGFPALDFLEIGVYLPTDCISLLEVLDSSPVTKLDIYYQKPQLSDEWKMVYSAIRDHCSHDTLECLNITEHLDESLVDNLHAGDILQFDALKPLLVFHNLQKLDIDLHHGLYICDSTSTEEMAASWTKIKHLYLNLAYGCRSQWKSTITLDDLLPFAVHCPDLEHLAISIDATSPPEIGKLKPGNGVAQTSLIELQIGDSPAAGVPACIAAFLSSVFPSLVYIVTMESREETEAEWRDDATNHIEKIWEDAMNLLGSFAAVREQEMWYHTFYK
ncbi:hypothetical protein BDQ17DRAFT_1433463 [Cyathus striatus]|nr:hypothetical protein BDQ17DRAFT_1433463 [Cyathus striatus]